MDYSRTSQFKVEIKGKKLKSKKYKIICRNEDKKFNEGLNIIKEEEEFNFISENKDEDDDTNDEIDEGEDEDEEEN